MQKFLVPWEHRILGGPTVQVDSRIGEKWGGKSHDKKERKPEWRERERRALEDGTMEKAREAKKGGKNTELGGGEKLEGRGPWLLFGGTAKKKKKEKKRRYR